MDKKVKIKHDINQLAEMFKSIGHPERLQIINLMCINCNDKLSVKSIYETLNLEQSIVSRHLGIMKRSGLMNKEVEGRNTYYTLNASSPAYSCALNLFSIRAF